MAKKKAGVKQVKPATVKKEKKSNSTALKRMTSARPAQKAKKKAGKGRYFKEVRQEMTRVSWPTREDVFQSTLIVLAVVIFFSIFVGITDVIFINLVKYLALGL